MSRELPILFSGPMVRAILDGRKTKTRRVMNPQPVYGRLNWESKWGSWSHGSGDTRYASGVPEQVIKRCPYRPGDLLWVRETWQLTDGCGPWRGPLPNAPPSGWWVDYAADGHESTWRPSIFMPKWASRLWLRVTDVRAERVQDINEEDAKWESVGFLLEDDFHGITKAMQMKGRRGGFKLLWDSINGKRPRCSWQDNPWVWVYTFERTEEGSK